MGTGLPGIGTARTTSPRKILASMMGALFLPGGRVIDGSQSRDPLNTGDVDVLRAGMLMGKRSNNGLFAPSIIGVITAAVLPAGATLTVSVATGTELDRRIAAGGLFKIVGPTVPGGTVHERVLSYSGTAKAGTVTLAANGAVAEVQTSTLDGLMTGGTFTLTYKGYTTAAIAFDATVAQIQAALLLLPSVNSGDITMQAAHEPDTELTCTWTFATTLGQVPMLSMDVSLATTTTVCTFVETVPGELVGYATCGQTCVQNVVITGLAAGNVRIKLTNPTTGVTYVTGPLAHAATLADIETEITAAIGVNAVAVSGTDIDAFALTFDDVDHTWANLPVPLVEILPDSTATATARPQVTMTTVGVIGDYCIGSLLMPYDGSENPIAILTQPDTGIKVTDVDALDIDVPFAKALIGGIIDAEQIINYPTESSLRTWLKNLINNAVGGRFVFDDDFRNLV